MANPSINSYWEGVDDVSPGSATFSDENASSVREFVVKDINDGELVGVMAQILGTVYANQGNHNLFRTLPRADPIFNFLYADSISNIRGVGEFTKVNAAEDLDAPPMPSFALYTTWKMNIHFSPRPYAVLPDEQIVEAQANWFRPPPAPPNIPSVFRYAPEWKRYTDFTVVNQNDYVSATASTSSFKAGSMASPPHGATFPGKPRIFLPNQILKIFWYKVPISYILHPNSYLNSLRGYVNTRPFFEYANGHTFPIGSLLYLGYNPRIYTSPVQDTDPWLGGTTTYRKNVNLELNFLVTTRVGTDVPTDQTAYAIPNLNFVPQGHNLQVFFPHRKFYYVTFKDEGNTDAPYFYSAPFEMLFTNPAAPQDAPIP